MEWKQYLTPGERRVIDAMDTRHAADSVVRRRIYDRCWKRMARRTKAARENAQETTGVDATDSVGLN